MVVGRKGGGGGGEEVEKVRWFGLKEARNREKRQHKDRGVRG